jgi:hypothetical protein
VDVAGGNKSSFATSTQKYFENQENFGILTNKEHRPSNIKRSASFMMKDASKLLDKCVLRGNRGRVEGGGVRTPSHRNRSACYEMLHKASDSFNTTQAMENGSDATWNIKSLCRTRSVKTVARELAKYKLTLI